MKRHLVGLFVLALYVLGTLGAEQKFSSLPIGYNLEGYISAVEVSIMPYDPKGPNGWNEAFRVLIDPIKGGSAVIRVRFPYNHTRDGKLVEFATNKLHETVGKIPAVLVNEKFSWGWGVDAITEGIGGLLPTYNGESKPAIIAIAYADKLFNLTLRNGAWEVPEEVFGKVKFQFGVGVSYYIPGVTDLEVNLFGVDGRVSMFSTREQISDLDNPCDFAAITLGLGGGLVIIPNEIALARTSWWEYAEITLLTTNESATFRVNRTGRDGVAIRWSEPPPSFFVPPPPKIASLKRVGGATELAIEGTPNASVTVEWIEKLGDEWQPLYPPYRSLDANGNGLFTHETAGATGFYRVRSENSATAKKQK